MTSVTAGLAAMGWLQEVSTNEGSLCLPSFGNAPELKASRESLRYRPRQVSPRNL